MWVSNNIARYYCVLDLHSTVLFSYGKLTGVGYLPSSVSCGVFRNSTVNDPANPEFPIPPPLANIAPVKNDRTIPHNEGT